MQTLLIRPAVLRQVRLPRLGRGARTEAIELINRRFGYFPAMFKWRGVEHRIERVERTWTLERRTVQRQYFKVICAEAEYIVYHDLRHNLWRIETQ